jgi:flagellar FliJ protein
MSALAALVVAVEVASRKRDDARMVLQDALAAQQAARSQLDQLEDYARETQARWGMKADTAVKPEVMFHHYHFMDRLGHAWKTMPAGWKRRAARFWRQSCAWPA